MKKLHKLLAFLLMVPFLVFVSCKDEDDPTPVSDFETLTEFMVQSNLDLDDVLAGWIVGPPAEADVATFVDTYTILDIRSTTDFNAGHIDGAIDASLGTILTDATSATKPILVVCYTGQSAGHAVMALRLSGYPDAKVLKWGMSGWNSTFSGPWNGNSGTNGNVAVGHAEWTTSPTETVQQFGTPDLNITASAPAEMLAERVTAMLQGGFQGISCSDVLSGPDGYFINNYWAQTDVDHYGHIDGAYRIQPMTIAGGELQNLDPSSTVITYCWTGQTSSMITAYLTVLGYDAKSLKFGANGMIYSELESHKFVSPSVDLPVVTE